MCQKYIPCLYFTRLDGSLSRCPRMTCDAGATLSQPRSRLSHSATFQYFPKIVIDCEGKLLLFDADLVCGRLRLRNTTEAEGRLPPCTSVS